MGLRVARRVAVTGNICDSEQQELQTTMRCVFIFSPLDSSKSKRGNKIWRPYTVLYLQATCHTSNLLTQDQYTLIPSLMDAATLQIPKSVPQLDGATDHFTIYAWWVVCLMSIKFYLYVQSFQKIVVDNYFVRS